jgi:hypothetical protein
LKCSFVASSTDVVLHLIVLLQIVVIDGHIYIVVTHNRMQRIQMKKVISRPQLGRQAQLYWEGDDNNKCPQSGSVN